MTLPWWVKPAVVLVACFACYGAGRLDQFEDDLAERNAERVKELETVAAWVAQRTARARALGAAEVKEREKIRVVFERIEKEVERIVDRPVYHECALDADGLRAWNEANSGQGSAGLDSSGAVPALAGAGVADSGVGPEESR